ncbi:hypothetical protein AAG906_002422 [Vitis piasezkii]
MTNHSTKNCGHTYDYCRRRKNTMGGGQGRSKVNHAATLNEGKEDVTNFPLSQKMLHATKQASANLVGNVPNYEELSGPSIGEDDWDGNRK